MGTKSLIPSKRLEENVLRPFEAIDSVFEDMFDLSTSGYGGGNTPAVDMKETEKEIILDIDLPGVDKKDIKLDLTEQSVAVSCERRDEKEEHGRGGYRIKETRYGSIYRAFSLPAAVKTGESKAVYKNGVLKITLQKQKPAAVHQIMVE